MSKSSLDKNLPEGGTPTCAPLKSLLFKIPPASSIISARVAPSGTSTIPLLFILPHIATFLLELLVIFFSSSSLKTEKTEPLSLCIIVGFIFVIFFTPLCTPCITFYSVYFLLNCGFLLLICEKFYVIYLKLIFLISHISPFLIKILPALLQDMNHYYLK